MSTSTVTTSAANAATTPAFGVWQRLRTSWAASPTVIVSLAWLLVVLVSAVAPAVIAPGDPLTGEVSEKLRPPSLTHWFGTDQLGRDLFTRVVHGSGLTLQAVLIALALGLIVGTLLGLVAGFVGHRTDAVIMRIADVLLAIPNLLLSLAVIVALGFGTVNVAIAVGVTSIASVSRVMRAEVLKVKQSPYIEAARAGGARWGRILLLHVLPNAIAPVVVLGVLEFGSAILAISALSFLGYGATPPAPEWGALVSQGRDFLAAQGWLSTLPGLVIVATVLSANRIANALNDRTAS
ncbi:MULTISPECIES: ABC transporter permease [unclassified Pseudoclavibacter]|uniref:ABC transporter permease n=1 Tax=unclassified Pseudoclavibacter TaxID=2615177 RepID=UPI0013014424|nr:MULTISPECIES: ABC transporter permease [unclassified Pseudoclavibacter]KAB1644472.1 ABC transporter permease [Pseudoclavibacter sp. CFCC 14310]KAB1664024.1 ABC transporter permease [Pseudoclavibacter sp. CFCC 13611]